MSDLIGAFPGFLVYASVLLLICLVLIFYLSPRYGNSNILIYISICSLLGAFTVSSVKGLGFAIRTGREGGDMARGDEEEGKELLCLL